MIKPLVSVVIPIYNVEDYLSDTIESVIVQDIGFQDNIEIILVDDGSTDSSSDVCRHYVDKYPNNMIYIRQDNGGVSSARNAGLQKAKGKYVHFFDGDDLISKSFYNKAAAFLDRHQQVNLVAIKLKFFDEIIDSHPLNYKFKIDTVIDLTENPDNPLLHIPTCLFRKDALEEVRFDERLSVTEDLKFISDVLVKKPQYGVLKTPTYYYRKRSTGGSAIAGKERNKTYYIDTPKHVYEHLLATWGGTSSIQAIEYTLLYDISYRLDQNLQTVLTKKEEGEYKQSIKNIITSISDEVIIRHKFLSIYKKVYILKQKYGKAFADNIEVNKGVVYFKKLRLYDYNSVSVYFDFLTNKGDTYLLEGYIDGSTDIPGVSYDIEVSGKKTPVHIVPRAQREQSFLGDTYYDGGAFEVQTPISAGDTVQFVIAAGKDIYSSIVTGPFTRFGALKLTYRRDNNLLLKRNTSSIQANQYSAARHLALELRLWFQILINWRLRTAYSQLQKLLSRNLDQLGMKAKLFEILKPVLIIGESVLMIPRAFILRTAYYASVSKKSRPIWIISDRGMAAGDNGEAFFRYVNSLTEPPADVYFVISKKSKDYERIKSIGPVLNQSSLRYKLKFLMADKIISSQADVETTNPFIRQMDHYVDLFNFDFVFLQHGIIRHNLSSWLNRFNKNISLFITSAQKEYDSIFSNPYYYHESNILLSGLPRYDYLNNSPNKKLILAPTYRKSLAKAKTDKNGSRRYDSTFKTSEYRKFYNNLMNDERLRAALRGADMQGEFYLHPAFSSQRQDFDENDEFKVMNFPYDYKTAFSEGELMISDHSSVVFDFAYLKKPVAYAHFDVDTFFNGHSYDKSNFFVDEDDGFGEVYYDYNGLVEGVIKNIERGCAMSNEYKKRVDNFFYRVDKHNAQRVYGAIIRQDEV